jgi:hypothetical protein
MRRAEDQKIRRSENQKVRRWEVGKLDERAKSSINAK